MLIISIDVRISSPMFFIQCCPKKLWAPNCFSHMDFLYILKEYMGQKFRTVDIFSKLWDLKLSYIGVIWK